MTLGPAFIDPESLVHSRYIVIWGCNVVSSNLHLWPFIREAQRQGAVAVANAVAKPLGGARRTWTTLEYRPAHD